MNKTVSNQCDKRKKYERIRCPKCGGISHVVSEGFLGNQIRKCNKCKHEFGYSYLSEALSQEKFNYKIFF